MFDKGPKITQAPQQELSAGEFPRDRRAREHEERMRLAGKIEKLDKTLESPEKRMRFREALRFFVTGGAQVIGYTVALSTMLNAGATRYREYKDGQVYEGTRYQVKKTRNEKGEVVYEHEDPETTRIIEYLAGRGEMSEETNLTCLREMIGSSYDVKGELTKEIYGLASEEEARTFLIKNFPIWSEGYKKGVIVVGTFSGESILKYKSAEAFADTEIKQIKRWHNQYRKTISPKLYELLWRVEIESGSPKIRWGGYESFADTDRYKVGESSDYNFETNTIRLDSAVCTYHVYHHFAAEEAHAQNRHKDPGEFFRRHESDTLFLRTYQRLYNNQDYRVSYDAIQYDAPGTEEYIAHNIVEPKIYAQLDPAIVTEEGTWRNPHDKN